MQTPDMSKSSQILKLNEIEIFGNADYSKYCQLPRPHPRAKFI